MHRPRGTDVGQFGECLLQPGLVIGRLADAGDGARIREVPGDLGGGAGLVDRDHDGSREEDREVDQCPLVGRARDEADLVAGLDATGNQTLRERDHLVQEIGCGDITPSAAVGNGEQRQLWRLLHPFHE